jgi:hypothetical protein
MATGKPANIINHYTFVVDESWSMSDLASVTVRVFDRLVAHLARRSKEKGQETRVSVYLFSSYGTERCVIWDMDVLRVPSLAGLYHPDGMTALVRATTLAISDLRTEISQKYGDHSFLLFALTDGQENNSAGRHQGATLAQIAGLRGSIESAPDNETYACLVPDQQGVHEAKQYGFPAANISVWDPTSEGGLEEAGRLIEDISDAYMDGRERGVRGYSARSGGGLFKLRDFSAADVQSSLTPMTPGQYLVLHVVDEQPIKDAVIAASGSYRRGSAYYQFMKNEIIQSDKEFVVEMGGRFYSGPAARSMLGLPGQRIRVKPDHKAGCTIFVQSNSVNRKLIPGTRLLVLR